jgi:hypothetical protein
MRRILKLDDMQKVERASSWRGKRCDELSGWLKRRLRLGRAIQRDERAY